MSDNNPQPIDKPEENRTQDTGHGTPPPDQK